MSISKVHCLHCDKKIGENEEFIFVNENEVYCRDCVEEEGENKPVKLWGSYLEFQNGDCRGINSEFLKDFEILE